jgi:hypothetical protein
MIPTILLTVATLGPINSPDNHKIARSVALIESGNNHLSVGDGGKAIGRYQMHRPAWDDANKYLHSQGLLRHSWSERFDPGVQEMMALAYIQTIKRMFLSSYGRLPTATEIYFAYTMGFSRSKSIDFDIRRVPSFKRNAIQRFTNLYTR